MAIADSLRALMGINQAEAAQPDTPTPNITNAIFGNFGADQPFYKRSAYAIQAPPPERTASLSSPKTSVKAKKKSPLGKVEEVKASSLPDVNEVDQSEAAVIDKSAKMRKLEDPNLSTEDRLKLVQELQNTPNAAISTMGQFGEAAKKLPPGTKAEYKQYANLIPSNEDLATAVQQANYIRSKTNELDPQNIANNTYLEAQAKKLLEEKMNDPYRGVDVEAIDRLTSSLMGKKMLGMKNPEGPEKNLELLAQMNKLKQFYDLTQQKDATDYIRNVTKPMVQWQAGAQIPQPPQPRAGKEPKETRPTEIDKYTNEIQKAMDLAEKGRQLLKVIQQGSETNIIRDNPNEPWWSGGKKHIALKEEYDRLVNEIRTSNKEARGFGGAFTALESRLNDASLPGGYSAAITEKKTGIGNRIANLQAFIDQADLIAQNKARSAEQGFTRPGEPGMVKERIAGYRKEAEVGAGANTKKTVPDDIIAIMKKAQGGK